MLKGVATKVAWVGRATSMVFGLALVLALLFGVASMALAGTGVNGVFNLCVKDCGPGADTVVNADPSLDSQSFDCIDFVSPGP